MGIEGLQRGIADCLESGKTNERGWQKYYEPQRQYRGLASFNHILFGMAIGLWEGGDIGAIEWWEDCLEGQLTPGKETYGFMGGELGSRIYVTEHLFCVMAVRMWAQQNHRTLWKLTEKWLAALNSICMLGANTTHKTRNTWASGYQRGLGLTFCGARSFSRRPISKTNKFRGGDPHHLDQHALCHIMRHLRTSILPTRVMPRGASGSYLWRSIAACNRHQLWVGAHGPSWLPPTLVPMQIWQRESGSMTMIETARGLATATAPIYSSVIDFESGKQSWLAPDSGQRPTPGNRHMVSAGSSRVNRITIDAWRGDRKFTYPDLVLGKPLEARIVYLALPKGKILQRYRLTKDGAEDMTPGSTVSVPGLQPPKTQPQNGGYAQTVQECLRRLQTATDDPKRGLQDVHAAIHAKHPELTS